MVNEQNRFVYSIMINIMTMVFFSESVKELFKNDFQQNLYWYQYKLMKALFLQF